MVDIISKKEGPRKEDLAVKHMLKGKERIITGLADAFTSGGYSASKQEKMLAQNKKPEESTSKYFILSTKDCAGPPEPYVRISINGRVVIVDNRNSEQMHFLGEIRRFEDGKKFLLATAENKFFSPAEKEVTDMLTECDGVAINDAFTEEMLKDKLAELLGI